MPDDSFSLLRGAMIDSQLRTSGVADPRIVDAFAAVPRERFVPAAMARLAYIDAQVAVSPGRALMEPLALGRLLEAARIGAADRVLLIGGATGYAAAVIAKLAATVTMVECDAGLADAARGTLATLDVSNVAIVEGALAEGAPGGGPYDVLFFDGAVPDLPSALLAQLADGGRVAAAMGDGRGMAKLTAGVVSGGAFGGTELAEAAVASLPGFERAKQFVF